MGAFLATRTPHAAQALWSMAGGYDDPRLNALSFGLLAPRPHNLQPWIIELEGTDAFILHHDASRRLPHTDPFDRQITIGLGCFWNRRGLRLPQMDMKLRWIYIQVDWPIQPPKRFKKA